MLELIALTSASHSEDEEPLFAELTTRLLPQFTGPMRGVQDQFLWKMPTCLSMKDPGGPQYSQARSQWAGLPIEISVGGSQGSRKLRFPSHPNTAPWQNLCLLIRGFSPKGKHLELEDPGFSPRRVPCSASAAPKKLCGCA